MITKQQLADAYLDKATADAEALLAHGTGVHAYIMDHFPDEIPLRVLEMYVGDSALLGKLRAPSATGRMMLETVQMHIAREMK